MPDNISMDSSNHYLMFLKNQISKSLGEDAWNRCIVTYDNVSISRFKESNHIISRK